MSSGSNRTLAAGLGLVAVLLAGNAPLAYRNTRQLAGDAAWVAHTHAVLNAHRRRPRPGAVVCALGLAGMSGYKGARAIRAGPGRGGPGLRERVTVNPRSVPRLTVSR